MLTKWTKMITKSMQIIIKWKKCRTNWEKSGNRKEENVGYNKLNIKITIHVLYLDVDPIFCLYHEKPIVPISWRHKIHFCFPLVHLKLFPDVTSLHLSVVFCQNLNEFYLLLHKKTFFRFDETVIKICYFFY